MLDKLDLENRTSSTITAKGRTDVRLWSPIALREAVINAIVHNDYTREVPPKFEIFSDRIEITSAGTLPEGLTQAEFFEGYSIPRNKELMRIFKDLELVEHLGSGIPRITQFCPESCFRFTENFLRSTFPAIEPVHAEDDAAAPVTPEGTPEVTPEVRRMLGLLICEMARTEIMVQLGLRDEKHFREHYQQVAMAAGLIERTLPDKPNSRLQKYRLTEKGRSLLP